VAAHFLTKEFTKRYIDAMALYKLNPLHWHLTDMGWVIEIKKVSELTRIESWPPIAHRWRRIYGKCTQGFYTQDDVREIVAYAATRRVTIVPEIELPAHSSVALACHPELPRPNWQCPVERIDSYFRYPFNYCAGNDETFKFLEGVLSEVIDLFPSTYIHIGGDEPVQGAWKACPKCQARIKEEGLKTKPNSKAISSSGLRNSFDPRGGESSAGRRSWKAAWRPRGRCNRGSTQSTPWKPPARAMM
jgi:hexosaminidase